MNTDWKINGYRTGKEWRNWNWDGTETADN